MGRAQTATILLALMTVATPAAARGKATRPATKAPEPAAAPTPQLSPAEEAKREAAKKHFEQGVALYREDDLNGALVEFNAAYEGARSPVVLYNLGLVYKALHRYVESIDALERYLKESATAAQKPSDERRAEVEKLVAEMHALLATLVLQVEPIDARIEVKLNGRPAQPTAGGELTVATGVHTLDIAAEGFVPWKKELTVAGGDRVLLTVPLRVVPRTGKVHIAAAQPATAVRIDGSAVGSAPLSLELTGGGHQLEAAAPGYLSHRAELLVTAGQERQLFLTLETVPVPPPPPSPTEAPFYRKWWFWAAVGGLALATTAVVVIATRPGVEDPLPGTLDPGLQPVP